MASDDITVPPLLVIVGETASGKSTLAMELAKRLGGEIICADSWTVRREVNIGTAKPSPEERAAVPHHLLDIVGPDEDFTAALFKRLANDMVNDISRRGKLPILVGGTGLYVDGILFDYGFLPHGDRSKRAELNELDIDQLIAIVRERGLSTEGIDIRNKRRLMRLMETDGAVPTRGALRAHTLIIGLSPDRQTLNDAIDARVDSMIASGLEDEVAALAGRYGWECEALKGVGYAQWKDYFEGRQSLSDTRQRIIKATRDLAKRQRTWFKRNKSIRWFPTPVNEDQLVEIITTTLFN